MGLADESGDSGIPRRRALLEVVRMLGWLGVIGVGGPAAHIAMMRRRVVERDRWVSEDDFARLVGACALVPGPNSTEMAMALGARRAGWRGLVAGGAAFIVPTFAIVCVIAFLYEDVLTSAVIAEARRWIVPIVVAIVLDALWSLRRTAMRDRRDVLVVFAALAAAVLGVPELLVLLVVGLASIVLRTTATGGRLGVFDAPFVVPLAAQVITPSLTKIFLVFMQIGSVIYGSGYVLLVFLDSEVVGRGWITAEVLLDAVSVGQFTPGPCVHHRHVHRMASRRFRRRGGRDARHLWSVVRLCRVRRSRGAVVAQVGGVRGILAWGVERLDRVDGGGRVAAGGGGVRRRDINRPCRGRGVRGGVRRYSWPRVAARSISALNATARRRASDRCRRAPTSSRSICGQCAASAT